MRRSPRLFALAASALVGVAGPAWAQTAPKEGDMAPDVRLKATQVKKALPEHRPAAAAPRGRAVVVLIDADCYASELTAAGAGEARR